jgi:hypothetical protein
MGFNLPLLNRRRRLGGGAPAFSPAVLFSLAEPGVWYDPSDLTTLFTDTAGTTPVTAPGQTVALALDKSKGLVLGPELVTNGTFDTDVSGWTGSSATLSWASGKARIEATSPTIPSFSARTNTTFSFVAGRAYVISGDITGVSNSSNIVNANVSVRDGVESSSPVIFASAAVPAIADGQTVSVRAIYIAATTANYTLHLRGFKATAAGPQPILEYDNISVRELPGFHATQSILASRPTYAVVPATGRRNLLLATDTLATQSRTVTAVAHTLSFTGTGTVTLSGASTAGPLVGTGASNRVSLTFTPTAASLTLTVSGSVTLAQLEIGSTATNYQRVGTAFDVTEAGVQSLSYLSFDGIDDFLVTPTITPGVDKVQAFAGVRKLSDAATGVVAELSVAPASSNGAIGLNAPGASLSVLYPYLFRSRGTTASAAFPTSGFAAPTTNVLTGLGDIAADTSILRVNGTLAASNTDDQGTGNYLAYPMYIGRRAGTEFPFNGHIYSLIVRFGANLDAATITSAESWAGGKTGFFAPTITGAPTIGVS